MTTGFAHGDNPRDVNVDAEPTIDAASDVLAYSAYRSWDGEAV